jgi:hypothetical protein
MKSRTALIAAALTLAGSAGTVALAAQPAAAEPPCVQKISVVNNAAFVMSYRLQTREGITTAPTDNYPINQTRTTDLTTTELPLGADVRPLVSAVAGDENLGNLFVSYCDNGQTATYSVTGTTLDFQVTLLT